MDPRVIADTALYLNSDLAASLLTSTLTRFHGYRGAAVFHRIGR
jgi:hypothetical protein